MSLSNILRYTAWGLIILSLLTACESEPVEVTRVVNQTVTVIEEVDVTRLVTSAPIVVTAESPIEVEMTPTVEMADESTMTDMDTPSEGDLFVYGDDRGDAPELASRGNYDVGVRTMTVISPDQIDIVNVSEQDPAPVYDRSLTLEVWYPAIIPEGMEALTVYTDVLGLGPDNPERPNTPFTFTGRALRDADPDSSDGPFPLLIVSHGYPGSRLMMSYLTENLASKGYVVVAIDHTDATFDNAGAFASTLVNRSLDVLFVLDEIANMEANEADSFLAGLVNAEQTAVVGYSMGGYGALNVAGGGYSQGVLPFVPGGHLASRTMDNDAYAASKDERIKAIVAFAPWGGPSALTAIGVPGLSFWDEAGLAGIEVPSLFVVGSKDDVSGYEEGVKLLFEGAVNSDRYMLVYQNALHNVAPNPPPPLARMADFSDFERYSEPAWDRDRMNNINQHFLTAFLGIHLKGEVYENYLDVTPLSSEGVWATNEDGSFSEDHSYWFGFRNRTAIGLELYYLPSE